jgi:hypothetical protein
MSSEYSSPASPSEYISPPGPEFLAAAAQRRNATAEQVIPKSQLLRQHEQQKMLRRLIDPGIYRPNSPEAAMASLKVCSWIHNTFIHDPYTTAFFCKTLSKIAENLIREPENPKFRQFKPTNNTIKRHLIETKGALEYAIAVRLTANEWINIVPISS